MQLVVLIYIQEWKVIESNWKERVLVQESQNNHPGIRLMILVTVFTRKSYHLWETIPKYSWLSSKIFIFIKIVGRESQYCAWLVPAPPDWHPPRLSSLCLNLWIQLGRQEKRNEQQFWTSPETWVCLLPTFYAEPNHEIIPNFAGRKSIGISLYTDSHC